MDLNVEGAFLKISFSTHIKKDIHIYYMKSMNIIKITYSIFLYPQIKIYINKIQDVRTSVKATEVRLYYMEIVAFYTSCSQ